jgi:predicted transcriptional regulator
MSSYSIEQDYSKNEEGFYICLKDNKKFNNYGSLENHLNKKYNISYITYLIQHDLDNKENYLKCKECGQYCKN